MQSMLMIDTFLVSPLGEESVAAMGMATAIVAFVLGIQMALANGTQMILSRAFGSGRKEACGNAFYGGLIISTGSGLLFSLLLIVSDQWLVSSLTDNESLQQKVLAYLDISVYLILFTAVTQTITALFNGFSKTKIPFKGYVIELPINCFTSYLYIYQLDMGVSGAALGSLTAILIRTLYLCHCAANDTDISLEKPADLKVLIRHTGHHFKEIFPFAANITILAIGITIYQLLFSQLSINEYVAITLLYPWIRVGSQFIVAWSHAAAILISQDIGSEQLDELETKVNTSIKVAVGLSFISSLLFLILHFTFPYIYSDLTQETYAAVALIAPLYIFLPLARGYNTVHGNILRAAGKTKSVFKINFTGQWLISLPLLALIIFWLDGSVFWAFAIQPFEELIKALPFRFLARKTVKEFNHEQIRALNYH
ncbi:polysaccharide biosynthesis C-terminal domain-containing protein [Vibrio sp. JC009]|uniref:MATE family efflux transporter n=1 Tax=Vibrio sp. JC009 TaxID=2912314 RepID=UPI0023B007B2|nr:MATE family efflux transporter [Vibrio sp. JC009]WED25006.1 polysaccharide biosynthesis C-terminal domain-containing protein [Vibrio sp. JC009]